MKLHFLGTSGYHPTERRHTACLMLPEAGVVLDAGTGMFRVQKLLQTRTLDVFLTHAHLDHIVGLTYLLGLQKVAQLERITVHGLPEKLAAVREHLFSELIFPVLPEWEMRPLAAVTTLADGGVLRHFPLAHPGESIGFRIDWPDRSLAYVTDTTARGQASPYRDVVQGVDVLVHECYFADAYAELAEKTGHSCATPVAELARSADVKRLFLVHTSPLADATDPVGLDTIRQIFPPAELPGDGDVVDF